MKEIDPDELTLENLEFEIRQLRAMLKHNYAVLEKAFERFEYILYVLDLMEKQKKEG